ncbi:MAG: glycosyltransferase [Clostridiales bacterium]|nr:glycosyltransferase [Clostridiales bacterium]
MISVIVPVYNIEKHISQCIDSLLTQTMRDLEILLIDDGSTDRSGEICRCYAASHENIRYFHQENRGVSAARNFGLSHAAGKWILFVDGDDFADEELAETLLSLADDEPHIASPAFFAERSGKAIPCNFFPQNFSCRTPEEKSDLFYQLMVAQYAQENQNALTAIGVPWGKLYRRSFLEKYELCFPVQLRRMQDNIFNMKAFYYAGKIRYENLHLYHYRAEHIQSYTAAYPPELYEMVLSCRDEFFAKDAFFQAEQMIHFRKAEQAEFFCTSIKHILLASDGYKDALPQIRELFSRKIYAPILSDPPAGQPRKLRLIRFLYDHSMYHFLYYGMGVLWRVKNMQNRLS